MIIFRHGSEYSASDRPYQLEFYEENGSMSFAEWLNGLTKTEPAKYDAIGYGLQEILAMQSINVCNSDFGVNLGDGLYEFRLRHDHSQLISRVQPHLKGTISNGPEVNVLVQVFFAAYGNKIILLLHGYDKGRDSSERRKRKEINEARKRLAKHPLTKSASLPLRVQALDWIRRKNW